MINHSTVRYISMFLLLLAVASCKSDDDGTEPADDFDREAMLQNIGNEVILPAFQNLDEEVKSLSTATTEFLQSPTVAQLLVLRDQYHKAYLSWEYCAGFNFGPSQNEALQASINTWPTDQSKIESNVINGNYNLNVSANLTATGFPALDYLLYGSAGGDAAITSRFVQEAALQQYLTDVVDMVSSRVGATYQAWAPDAGNYLQVFVERSGTDIGSSLGVMVNEFTRELELVKNARVGIPLGKKTLGVILPLQVEAYFSSRSVELAVADVEGLKRLYLGQGSGGTTANGLHNYLLALDAQAGDGLLANAISEQFETVLTKLNAISGSLSDAISNDPGVVEEAYVEIQRLVVLVKTDMTSSLGVQITYQDTDGD